MMKTKLLRMCIIIGVVLLASSASAAVLYGANNQSIYRYDPTDWSVTPVLTGASYTTSGG